MARTDRERYEKEKAEYKGPWKVPSVKHPNPPKKPMSAFLAFGNERRKAVAKANPSFSNAEISSLLSKLWKQCPEEVRQAYRDREIRERKAFKTIRIEWEKEKDLSLLQSVIDEGCEDVFDNGKPNCKDAHGDMEKKHQKGTLAPQSIGYSYKKQPWHEIYSQSFHNVVSMNLPHISSRCRSPINTLTDSATKPAYYSSCAAANKTFLATLEDYSIEEILQDEDLFEDFSLNTAGVPDYTT